MRGNEEYKLDFLLDEKLLNLKQIAEYLQISTSSIYSLVQNDKIPAYKLGRQWRFKRKEIDNWLENNSGNSK